MRYIIVLAIAAFVFGGCQSDDAATTPANEQKQTTENAAEKTEKAANEAGEAAEEAAEKTEEAAEDVE